ncbi:Gfo/Idh/MocA family oxidoreductase [Candidatus Woesearchaeota archaeon]|nr:Gfo/Idh/MocA family oxidoreductase [Candidatus Woesearchaeota archaeon]
MKVGVIGSGDWGRNHLRIYSELDCELVGLADINPERKKLAEQYQIAFFTDYREMLKKVDAVSVVVPTDLHYQVVKDCLNAGVHVLVEKPITNDAASAKELIDLAKKKKLVLAVGYLFRFNAAVKKVKEELKGLGEIQYITGRYIHSNKPPRKDSGVIFNFGVHLVDILNFILTDRPKKVYCQSTHSLSKEREDAALILLDYGRYFAALEMSWLHPLKKRDFWIVGSRAKIYADLFEQIVIKYPIDVGLSKTTIEPEINLEVNKNEPLQAELSAFLKAVKKGGNGIFEGSEELFTTRICELAWKSSKEHKEMLV